ncbi:hypothetical protein CC78DRAFT_548523 [Lojkania enalia]|uniref:Uncharacterized protein n=1 Tax=Lojkania enalia TaxID=147567 RepID=A0A9P4MYE9_9PLEO|nr:hypothetical protein CC78DRAFT_548523 [Didymosphaeria enalia]
MIPQSRLISAVRQQSSVLQANSTRGRSRAYGTSQEYWDSRKDVRCCAGQVICRSRLQTDARYSGRRWQMQMGGEHAQWNVWLSQSLSGKTVAAIRLYCDAYKARCATVPAPQQSKTVSEAAGGADDEVGWKAPVAGCRVLARIRMGRQQGPFCVHSRQLSGADARPVRLWAGGDGYVCRDGSDGLLCSMGAGGWQWREFNLARHEWAASRGGWGVRLLSGRITMGALDASQRGTLSGLKAVPERQDPRLKLPRPEKRRRPPPAQALLKDPEVAPRSIRAPQ